jgi:hypothetical protein
MKNMPRSDRKIWATARRTTDLGDLMARWLEGKIDSRPGYNPRTGPDDETRHLVPVLARLCRAGYITTCSQPGLNGSGMDGEWWEQRAAVTGVVTDHRLLERLIAAARNARLTVRINDHRPGGRHDEPVVVTTCGGAAYTAFGGRVRAVDMAVEWAHVPEGVARTVSTGTYLTVCAPEYGPLGERLWSVLSDAVARY